MKPIPLPKVSSFVLVILAALASSCAAAPAPRAPSHTMQDFAVDSEEPTAPTKKAPRVAPPTTAPHDPESRAYHLERRFP